jgi:hypothetical protein
MLRGGPAQAAMAILFALVVAFLSACSDVGDSTLLPSGGDDATVDSEAGNGTPDQSDGPDSSGEEPSSDEGGDAPGSDAALDQLGPPDGNVEGDADAGPISIPDAGADTAPPEAGPPGEDAEAGSGNEVDAGSDTGLDAGADAAPEASEDVGAEPALEAGESEGGEDTGAPEAGPGPTVPCTASGQTNCVECFATAAGNGVCTGTEALVVQRDIAKGYLTAGQLDPNQSCYACLANSNYLPPYRQCESLTGTVGAGAQAAESKTQACLTTLSCVLGVAAGTFTSCANAPYPGLGISNCYCGSNYPSLSACNGASGVTSPPVNGACENEILAGLGYTTSTTGSTVIGKITTTTLAAGLADLIFKNAGSNTTTPSCPTCFQ